MSSSATLSRALSSDRWGRYLQITRQMDQECVAAEGREYCHSRLVLCRVSFCLYLFQLRIHVHFSSLKTVRIPVGIVLSFYSQGFCRCPNSPRSQVNVSSASHRKQHRRVHHPSAQKRQQGTRSLTGSVASKKWHWFRPLKKPQYLH